MEKVRLAVLISIILLILSGCVEGVYHVKVNSNGSGDVEYKLAVSPMILGFSSNEDPISELKKDAESEGYTVSNYKSGNLVGIQAKKHYNSIKDFKGFGKMFNQEGEIPLEVKKSFFTTTYILDSNVDLSDLTANEDEEFKGLESALINSIDLRFLLTLPVTAEEHNASNVIEDGKTLEWQLIPGQDNKIHLEAKVINITSIASAIVGFLALLAFLIILKKKKMKVVKS